MSVEFPCFIPFIVLLRFCIFSLVWKNQFSPKTFSNCLKGKRQGSLRFFYLLKKKDTRVFWDFPLNSFQKMTLQLSRFFQFLKEKHNRFPQLSIAFLKSHWRFQQLFHSQDSFTFFQKTRGSLQDFFMLFQKKTPVSPEMLSFF